MHRTLRRFLLTLAKLHLEQQRCPAQSAVQGFVLFTAPGCRGRTNVCTMSAQGQRGLQLLQPQLPTEPPVQPGGAIACPLRNLAAQ